MSEAETHYHENEIWESTQESTTNKEGDKNEMKSQERKIALADQLRSAEQRRPKKSTSNAANPTSGGDCINHGERVPGGNSKVKEQEIDR